MLKGCTTTTNNNQQLKGRSFQGLERLSPNLVLEGGKNQFSTRERDGKRREREKKSPAYLSWSYISLCRLEGQTCCGISHSSCVSYSIWVLMVRAGCRRGGGGVEPRVFRGIQNYASPSDHQPHVAMSRAILNCLVAGPQPLWVTGR